MSDDAAKEIRYSIVDPPMHYADAGSCWEVVGRYRDKNGYGQVQINNRSLRTHRVAWERANGPIPDGLFVLHKCDNPPCCNPEHLFLGTHQDNMRDRNAKGRQARGVAVTESRRAAQGARNGAKTKPWRICRGEKKPGAKLNAEVVGEIRASVDGSRTLAKRFGVSRAAIRMVLNGRSWRHVA